MLYKRFFAPYITTLHGIVSESTNQFDSMTMSSRDDSLIYQYVLLPFVWHSDWSTRWSNKSSLCNYFNIAESQKMSY